MEPIPDGILQRFNALLDKKSVPSSMHEDYRKWLRYYLDYRGKYPLPVDRSGQVRLFIEKMRSKGQSGKSLNQAAHALSLFFSLQTISTNVPVCAEMVTEAPSLPVAASAADVGQPSGASAPANAPAIDRVLSGVQLQAARPGRKYNEWWSMEKTISVDWDEIIREKLAGEIKARHYLSSKMKEHRASILKV